MRHLVRFAYLALAHVWASIPVYASDIVIIGEFHDNPHHHLTQAKVIDETSPTSVVFEMLVPEQAENYNSSTDKSIDSIEALLQWEDFGWPAFELYEPIFSALGASHVFGAGLPRQDLGEAFQNGIVASFGHDADIFGLTQPLAPQEQKKREALQARAHCDAMPSDMLPAMVDIQRLRDARLAQVALEALETKGAPVVVITGNGHARKDWAIPVYIAKAAPSVSVHVIGQTEENVTLDGDFDEIRTAPSIRRPDPCLAFK